MPARYDRPDPSEYAPYYQTYVGQVPDGDLLDFLGTQVDQYQKLVGSLPDSRGDYSYAPGKWTIKQLIGHVIDAERVFSYRALVFGRNDPASLPSFDENAWMAPARFDQRTVADLLAEFKAVRASTLALLGHLPQEAVTRVGTASGKQVSVRGLAYIIAGHVAHHGRILAERYF